MKIDQDIILGIFVILLLWLSLGSYFDRSLDHETPYGYIASDAFQHQIRTESIKESGDYRYEAPYIVTGLTDVIGFYPPAIYHVAAINSVFSGVETYDTIFHIIFLTSILYAGVVYYIIKNYNKKAAILYLPFTILLFTGNFPTGISFGQWPAISAHLFLGATIWSLTKIKLKGVEYLTGIFLAATFLVHTSEFIFTMFILILYSAFKLYKKDKIYIKKIIKAGILTAILTIYYAIIFKNTWMVVQAYEFSVVHVTQSFPTIKLLADFNILILILAAIGVITLLLYRKFSVAFLFATIMLLLGYTNLIGFGLRAFQVRFFWPLYIAVFAGFGLYFLFTIAKQKNTTILMGAALIISLLLIGSSYNSISTQGGIMIPQHWEAFEWVRYNTQEDENIFLFYGENFGQTSMLYNLHRTQYVANTQKMIEAVQTGTLVRELFAVRPSDSGAAFPYRTGLFSFEFHGHENPALFEETENICKYDYYLFDKVAVRQQIPQLIQYSLVYREKFLANGMQEVYSNELVSILKNDHEGDCLE